MLETIECEEFGAIDVGLERLIVDGALALDPRISDRGLLNVSLSKGKVVFRADKFVGLIPLTDRLAVRVRPRARIGNLSEMIVRSGVAPTAILEFSRGYLPRFSFPARTAHMYFESLLRSVERIAATGLMKSYSKVEMPPSWRGRLLVSETVSQFRSKNQPYKAQFDFRTLTYGSPENKAIKRALHQIRKDLVINAPKSPLLPRVTQLLEQFSLVPDHAGRLGPLLQDLSRAATRLPIHYSYYREALWTTYLLLQDALPDVANDGFISLDSLVVDVSKVFEAYVRLTLAERIDELQVFDGNRAPAFLFSDNKSYSVHPDIIVSEKRRPVAVLDMKYKPSLKESDRYEVLSFMDALSVASGGFICPQTSTESSRYLGTTASGKALSLLRFDLAAPNMDVESDRLAENVRRLVRGQRSFL